MLGCGGGRPLGSVCVLDVRSRASAQWGGRRKDPTGGFSHWDGCKYTVFASFTRPRPARLPPIGDSLQDTTTAIVYTASTRITLLSSPAALSCCVT